MRTDPFTISDQSPVHMLGIFRHADAGYIVARHCVDEHGVKIPMP